LKPWNTPRANKGLQLDKSLSERDRLLEVEKVMQSRTVGHQIRQSDANMAPELTAVGQRPKERPECQRKPTLQLRATNVEDDDRIAERFAPSRTLLPKPASLERRRKRKLKLLDVL
jgi:hypothetical protein